MDRALRSIFRVSGRTPDDQPGDDLFIETGYVVFVESIAHAYSRIEQVVPDLVVISSEIDDAATCQLLSMLKLDRRSSSIPVLPWVTLPEQIDSDHDAPSSSAHP